MSLQSARRWSISKGGDRASAFNDRESFRNDNGAFAQYARFDAVACFVLPPGIAYEESTSFPGAHFTTAQILYMPLPIPTPLTPEAIAFSEMEEDDLI